MLNGRLQNSPLKLDRIENTPLDSSMWTPPSPDGYEMDASEVVSAETAGRHAVDHKISQASLRAQAGKMMETARRVITPKMMMAASAGAVMGLCAGILVGRALKRS